MTTKMFEIADDCLEEIRKNERMKLTHEDKIDFENATCCYLCDQKFDTFPKKLQKVRDHDHRTGCYRGAAHLGCNINYFCNRCVPVVFHNLRGYDSHLIVKELYSLYPDKKISVIPNSFEKFMTFKMGSLKVIDSFQFMASSLEKLVTNLYEEKDKYTNFNSMKQYFSNHMDTLCQKGFYPY